MAAKSPAPPRARAAAAKPRSSRSTPQTGSTARPAARGGSTARSTARPTSATRPQRAVGRKSGLGRVLSMCARALAAVWRTLARAVGSLIRAVGRGAASARDLDAAHRRDGWGLALLGIAVITAIGIWWHGAGPVGSMVDSAVRVWIGLIAVVFPVVLLICGGGRDAHPGRLRSPHPSGDRRHRHHDRRGRYRPRDHGGDLGPTRRRPGGHPEDRGRATRLAGRATPAHRRDRVPGGADPGPDRCLRGSRLQRGVGTRGTGRLAVGYDWMRGKRATGDPAAEGDQTDVGAGYWDESDPAGTIVADEVTDQDDLGYHEPADPTATLRLRRSSRRHQAADADPHDAKSGSTAVAGEPAPSCDEPPWTPPAEAAAPAASRAAGRAGRSGRPGPDDPSLPRGESGDRADPHRMTESGYHLPPETILKMGARPKPIPPATIR